jgi:hypothetical protein
MDLPVIPVRVFVSFAVCWCPSPCAAIQPGPLFFAFFFSFKSEDALPCTASAAVAPADTADVTVPAALPSTSGLAAPLPNPLLAEVQAPPPGILG